MQFTKRFVNVVYVLALASMLGACSGGNFTNPAPIPGGENPPAGSTTVKLHADFTRVLVRNPDYDPQFGIGAWKSNGVEVCKVGEYPAWDATTQQSPCDVEALTSTSTEKHVNYISVADGAGATKAIGSEWVGRKIILGGRELVPTVEGLSEGCYYTVDRATLVVTPTDKAGNPK